jgi:hypothetical protein
MELIRALAVFLPAVEAIPINVDDGPKKGVSLEGSGFIARAAACRCAV